MVQLRRRLDPLIVLPGPMHVEHGRRVDCGVSRRPAGAQDRPRLCCQVNAILEEAVVNVDGNHFAEHYPRLKVAVGTVLQSDELR